MQLFWLQPSSACCYWMAPLWQKAKLHICFFSQIPFPGLDLNRIHFIVYEVCKWTPLGSPELSWSTLQFRLKRGVINASMGTIVPPFLLHLKRTLYVSLGSQKSPLKPFHLICSLLFGSTCVQWTRFLIGCDNRTTICLRWKKERE